MTTKHTPTATTPTSLTDEEFRLLSAARDMLSVLKQLIPTLEEAFEDRGTLHPDNLERRNLNDARAAIAKAEGIPPSAA